MCYNEFYYKTKVIKMKEAYLYDKNQDGSLTCRLCRFECVIRPGKKGRCGQRMNTGGQLVSLNYSRLCSAADDPIEKKPLYHFKPGSRAFSIAAPGCNFRCKFCQNWQISQSDYIDDSDAPKDGPTPEQIVKAALQSDCESIAYTYTEPTIFYELAKDTALMAKDKGLCNVFVSNGYMSDMAIDDFAGWLDAINIDLKAFTNDFYKDFCAAQLEPVLDSIIYIKKNTDVWIELTTLIIPGMNDGEDELKKLCEFIAEEVSPETPWHVSAFHPCYQMYDVPPTPRETIVKACQTGQEAGLKFIYPGNIRLDHSPDTKCPQCGRTLIERDNWTINSNNIENGKCPHCGAAIAGIW
jgi:pyruvate formate lyase activating enzyme